MIFYSIYSYPDILFNNLTFIKISILEFYLNNIRNVTISKITSHKKSTDDIKNLSAILLIKVKKKDIITSSITISSSIILNEIF